MVSSTSTGTTEFLGFATTSVGDEEGTVISDEDVLDLSLGGLINIYNIQDNIYKKRFLLHDSIACILTLLVVGNNALGDGLTDGVDLRRGTAALHADTDINLIIRRMQVRTGNQYTW